MKLNRKKTLLLFSALLFLGVLSTFHLKRRPETLLPPQIEEIFSGSTLTMHSLDVEIRPLETNDQLQAIFKLVHHFVFDEKKGESGSKSTFSIDFRLDIPATIRVHGKDTDLYRTALKNAYKEVLKHSRTIETGLGKKVDEDIEFRFKGTPRKRLLNKSVAPLDTIKTSDLFSTYVVENPESLPIDPKQSDHYFRSDTRLLFPGFVDLEKFKDLSITVLVDEKAVLSSLDPDRAEVFRRLMQGSLKLQAKNER